MLYAHVEDGSITHRGALPRNWRNISGLNLSDGGTIWHGMVGSADSS